MLATCTPDQACSLKLQHSLAVSIGLYLSALTPCCIHACPTRLQSAVSGLSYLWVCLAASLGSSPMQLTPSCTPPRDVGRHTMLSFFNQARPTWGLNSRAPHTGRSNRLILRMRSGTRGLGPITCWFGGGDLLQTKDQAIIHWPYNELVTPTTKGSSPSPQ